ncbi:MAG: Stf0 family sulfotransferase [Pseudomonadota bacterium]
MFEQPAIIFCATQRSGSTMIVDDFQNATGRSATQTEAFYHLVIDQGVQNWSEAMDILTQYRAGEAIFFDKVMFPFIATLSDMIARDVALHGKNIFRKLLETAVPRALGQISNRTKPDAAYSSTAPFASFFKKAIWVYIRRANIFEQTVSKYTAETLHVWDFAEAYEGFNSSMPFDIDLAREYMAGIIEEDTHWLDFFKQHGITPIEIYYEDAVPNFPHYLNPLLAAVGLPLNMADLQPRRKEKIANARSVALAGVLENMLQRDLIREFFQRQAGQNTIRPDP